MVQSTYELVDMSAVKQYQICGVCVMMNVCVLLLAFAFPCNLVSVQWQSLNTWRSLRKSGCEFVPKGHALSLAISCK